MEASEAMVVRIEVTLEVVIVMVCCYCLAHPLWRMAMAMATTMTMTMVRKVLIDILPCCRRRRGRRMGPMAMRGAPSASRGEASTSFAAA